jgi:hypothetical protein
MNNKIIEDIETCDSLIMSYDSIIKIFDYIKRPISVIGYYYMSFDFYEQLSNDLGLYNFHRRTFELDI